VSHRYGSDPSIEDVSFILFLRLPGNTDSYEDDPRIILKHLKVDSTTIRPKSPSQSNPSHINLVYIETNEFNYIRKQHLRSHFLTTEDGIPSKAVVAPVMPMPPVD
jgi:hypothetical protein